MSGKLYIAAAGAGKTHKIISDAIVSNKKTLILTYTVANYEQIKSRIRAEEGIIPPNIIVQTWFSFLLKEGVRPYQGYRFKTRIKNILFTDIPCKKGIGKDDNRYYRQDDCIYKDRLSDCVVNLDNKSKGLVFRRLSKIYDCIYIDEVQDLVGYDLEILKRLIDTKIEVVMVGDPRQFIYSIHNESKYKKYNGDVEKFLRQECKSLHVTIDDITLNCTHRNNDKICDLANRLYHEKKSVKYVRTATHESEGIKIIARDKVEQYLQENFAVQLRYNKKERVCEQYEYYNFGESKGLDFDRVVIYPTKDMWHWIVDDSVELKPMTRAKLYVAITRARNTVIIVRMDDRECGFPNI